MRGVRVPAYLDEDVASRLLFGGVVQHLPPHGRAMPPNKDDDGHDGGDGEGEPTALGDLMAVQDNGCSGQWLFRLMPSDMTMPKGLLLKEGNFLIFFGITHNPLYVAP